MLTSEITPYENYECQVVLIRRSRGKSPFLISSLYNSFNRFQCFDYVTTSSLSLGRDDHSFGLRKGDTHLCNVSVKRKGRFPLSKS